MEELLQLRRTLCVKYAQMYLKKYCENLNILTTLFLLDVIFLKLFFI